MTRGKIIFITKTGNYYQTLEFNGDMYPEGYGGTIIEKYEDGGIQSYYDYERFSTDFERKHFGYIDSGEGLLSSFTLKDDCIDYTNNWTDYLYVINGSGRVIKALTEDGIAEIPIGEMAVFHFQKLNRLVQIRKRVPITFPKKKFVETIVRLQEIHDLKDNVNKLICERNELMDRECLDELGMLISHEQSVIELLEFIMNDRAKNIEHFIYELDYGRVCKPGTVRDFYGTDIDCSSAEALYDCLMKGLDKNNNVEDGNGLNR